MAVDDLQKAFERYNTLYSGNPIKQIGNTPQAAFYLLQNEFVWSEGDEPLSAEEIEEVEFMAPDDTLT
ncbi:hypothetical protein [Pseudovibrio sp. POLY-S9]|uniref:hypothetical protein n=1 Tax=Pseudovibrio sp. POLY-S9 TaxID=1576596 RepID=UPI00070B2BC2|nr:hypothetical protein [Pseudovibrio sp. POLY-S9]